MRLRAQVGKKIKALRDERKLSQQKLADLSGYSYQYINKLETTPSNISLDALERIANALKVDPGEIVSRTGLIKVTNKRMIKVFETALEDLAKVKDSIIED